MAVGGGGSTPGRRGGGPRGADPDAGDPFPAEAGSDSMRTARSSELEGRRPWQRLPRQRGRAFRDGGKHKGRGTRSREGLEETWSPAADAPARHEGRVGEQAAELWILPI